MGLDRLHLKAQLNTNILSLTTIQQLASEEGILLAARRESLLAVEALAAVVMSDIRMIMIKTLRIHLPRGCKTADDAVSLLKGFNTTASLDDLAHELVSHDHTRRTRFNATIDMQITNLEPALVQ